MCSLILGPGIWNAAASEDARGLTEKQLAKYYVQRRKDWKPRFDHWRFAKDQGISTDWLFDGDLRSHPRGAAPPRPHDA